MGGGKCSWKVSSSVTSTWRHVCNNFSYLVCGLAMEWSSSLSKIVPKRFSVCPLVGQMWKQKKMKMWMLGSLSCLGIGTRGTIPSPSSSPLTHSPSSHLGMQGLCLNAKCHCYLVIYNTCMWLTDCALLNLPWKNKCWMFPYQIWFWSILIELSPPRFLSV
jgi:hypothetical protein